MKRIIAKILIFICLIGVIYSSYNIIKWKLSVDENAKIKDELNDNIDKDYNINFKELKKKNSDTVAYLKVNNTKIDYVVVQGNDNEYYLKHNFNKEYNIAGWIFADYHNKFDSTDKNIVIFGHDTKDGSMFGTLKNVLEKSWQDNKNNRKILLVTEKDKYYYQVFSTYTIKPEKYYITTGFKDDNEYKEFINKIKSRSNYDYKTDITEQDTILTLSSCLGDGSKRVVLHAKLMK